MYNNYYDNTDHILYQLIIIDVLYPLAGVELIGEIPVGWQSVPRNFLTIIPRVCVLYLCKGENHEKCILSMYTYK